MIDIDQNVIDLYEKNLKNTKIMLTINDSPLLSTSGSMNEQIIQITKEGVMGDKDKNYLSRLIGLI